MNKDNEPTHEAVVPAPSAQGAAAPQDDDIADIERLAEFLAQEKTDPETTIQIIEPQTLADWNRNGVEHE